MMYAMKRTQIYLELAQQRALQELASEAGKSLSELIRQAIWDWIRAHKKPKTGVLSSIVGLYDDKTDPRGSIDHDDIYE